MLPGMELMGCQIEVPAAVMHHVVKVESSYNPYAIGVVGGRLLRQPGNLEEAVATAQMLESRGYNFSLGLAQVNRYNLRKYGLQNYETAFQVCPNLSAGARILRECHARAAGHWGKAFSCYYSGNFTTGYRHGYVQKVEASMRSPEVPSLAIPVIARNAAVPFSAQRRASVTRASSPIAPSAIQPIAAPFAAQPSLLERRAGLSVAHLAPAEAALSGGEVAPSQAVVTQLSQAPAAIPQEPFQATLTHAAQTPQNRPMQLSQPASSVSSQTTHTTDSAFVF